MPDFGPPFTPIQIPMLGAVQSPNRKDNHMELMTVKETRRAIRNCDEVRVQVCFGVSEAWLKIPKVEARNLLRELHPDDTPRDAEMRGCSFGEFRKDGVLFLG